MFFKNMNSCCAGYLMHALDYISPYNDWWVKNRAKMLKKYDRKSHGMTMNSPSINPQREVTFSRNNIKRWLKDHPDLDFDNILDPFLAHFYIKDKQSEAGKQFLLASTVNKYTNPEDRYSDRKLKINPDYVEGIVEDMKDALTYWYKNGYMIYAITNERSQQPQETALRACGLELIKSVTSRNGTTLNTWFINSKEHSLKSFIKWLGDERMDKGWMSGAERKKEEEREEEMRKHDEQDRAYREAWLLANPDVHPEMFDEFNDDF